MISEFLKGILLATGSISKPSRYNIRTYSRNVIQTIQTECENDHIRCSVRPIFGTPTNRNISFEISLLDSNVVDFVKHSKLQKYIPWTIPLFHGYFFIRASINLSNNAERLMLSADTSKIDSLERFLKENMHIHAYHIDKKETSSRFIFVSQKEMEKLIYFYGRPDAEALSKVRATKLAKTKKYEIFSTLLDTEGIQEPEYMVILSKEKFPFKSFSSWENTLYWLEEVSEENR